MLWNYDLVSRYSVICADTEADSDSHCSLTEHSTCLYNVLQDGGDPGGLPFLVCPYEGVLMLELNSMVAVLNN